VCASQLPASAAEALAAVRAGLAYLNGMDAAGLAGPVQAQCLRELARAESAQTAAQARVLSAFRASSASEADGQGSAVVGHHDLIGNTQGPNFWNYSHKTPGCSQANLQRVGGGGLFYCFAVN